MAALPNQLHIIPPNKDMTILQGRLHLQEPTSPRGVRAPIDLFLRHLAEDQEERSIVVIMSGMGTDGTLGVKAVKEHLGLALVQDTRSANTTACRRARWEPDWWTMSPRRRIFRRN